jgi:methyltransferase (TIGR00027 family)
MRSGKPSRTSRRVSAGQLEEKIDRTRRSLSAHPKKSPYPFWLRGMGVFNQFRTVFLDRAIAAAAPIAQLVILGAGFDARAWRLDTLGDTNVFEVDHPATQAVKRIRAEAIPPGVRQVRFVATDFRQDDMAASLRAAGYDIVRRTFWLWEGVALYLRPKAVAANLATFAALSAPGSRLALTYVNKDRGRIPRRLFLALMGEPIRSAYSPAGIAGLAQTCGWTCTSDSGIEDWLRELTPGLRLTRRQAGLQWFERIWVAEKSS